MKYDWVEVDTDEKEYGATCLDDGAIRCDFPSLGTYWDVRFVAHPTGGRAAIFPKGCCKAVYVAPVSAEKLAYISRGEGYTNKVAREGLELVCRWLRSYTKQLVGDY